MCFTPVLIFLDAAGDATFRTALPSKEPEYHLPVSPAQSLAVSPVSPAGRAVGQYLRLAPVTKQKPGAESGANGVLSMVLGRNCSILLFVLAPIET